MEELKVDFEVAQKLGRKMLVSTGGELHVYWGEGEKQVENIISNLDTAIRQGIHIIEGYQGVAEKIRGQELFLPGEAQLMSSLVGKLQGIVSRFLEPQELTFIEERAVRAELDRVCHQIGQVTNKFKVRAKTRLKVILPLTDERGKKSTRVLVRTGESAVDLLKRFDDINDKTQGAVLRTRKLVEEKMRIEGVIHVVYKALGRFLGYFQDDRVPDELVLKSVAGQVARGKVNLMVGLETIKVQPYLARIQSREVRRLWRLPEYVEQGRTDSFRHALEGAFKKLRPVIKEREARRIKRVSVDDKGQVKR